VTAGALGLDVSTWQHPSGHEIDWDAVRDAGYTFTIIKATQGTDWVSPWLARDVEDAFAAGLFVGAYHYFVAGVDPMAQGQWFKNHLEGLTLDMHAWLDFEVAPTANWTMAGWVNSFLEACKPERPGTGLYCDASMWEELKTANVAPPALWVASWGAEQPPAGATIWQTGQADVKGVPASVDVDRLMSTRGINLPTSPAPKPSAQTVEAVHPAHDEPEPVPDREASE
jgi:GH25 family lysozyme M1 (1,4-beta-N-acetylmuramidase)